MKGNLMGDDIYGLGQIDYIYDPNPYFTGKGPLALTGRGRITGIPRQSWGLPFSPVVASS